MKHPILKYSLKYGSMAALVCIVVALLQFYLLHQNPFGRFKAPSYGINVIFIFLSILFYRSERGGYLSFGEGFVLGFLTNLIAAFLTGGALFLFTQFVTNQPLLLWRDENMYIINMMREVQIKQFGEETYKKLVESSKIIPTPSTVLIDEITKKQLCIVAVTLVSLILRRNRPLLS